MGGEWKGLVQLLVPISIHLVAEEMTRSVLVDVTTKALCHPYSSCSQAIYITGLQQTVVELFRMVVVPILGQLSDDYGRKPFLLLAVSTTILPYIFLVINQSTGFVYAYYVLGMLSNIFSCNGNLFCLSFAYAADVIDESNRFAVFSWMTGLFSASRVLGDALARVLPESIIFQVSLGLLIFVPVYMALFLVETIKPTSRANQSFPQVNKAKRILWERYESMRSAARIVLSSPTLKCVILISFFFKLGVSGIDAVLLYYLKAAFGFDKNQLSEVLMLVGIGSIISQMVVLPVINPFVGEKLIFFVSLLSSLAYGKVLGFAAGVRAMAYFLSPLAMTPLTTLFLSENAPFNCKGFSIICASMCFAISLCCVCTLPTQTLPNKASEDDSIETPLLY
ncbi:unnamed protein product [Cuscuta campestris]|uniref:Major facilitator superfamily (MFS) profile domain-containing protein n=1 Tax=Cuscuta campestris TaxID=132261 RepID=A0A484LXM1_9ASTE|nr:unnamed protein product [Cuscuta campestris]